MRPDPSEPAATRKKAELLRELQQRVAAGTYRVAALKVADAILALHRNHPKD